MKKQNWKIVQTDFSMLFTILKTNTKYHEPFHMTQCQRQKQVQNAEEDLISGMEERVTAKLDDGQTIYSKANHFVACSGIDSLQYSDGRLCCFQAREGNE
jgi:hypothetical protein